MQRDIACLLRLMLGRPVLYPKSLTPENMMLAEPSHHNYEDSNVLSVTQLTPAMTIGVMGSAKYWDVVLGTVGVVRDEECGDRG